uniref:Uncharacterized protein n=1 Tax=Romanomermis culicivorax TaxID=13658 RepID=A0A915HW77_ROMCU
MLTELSLSSDNEANTCKANSTLSTLRQTKDKIYGRTYTTEIEWGWTDNLAHRAEITKRHNNEEKLKNINNIPLKQRLKGTILSFNFINKHKLPITIEVLECRKSLMIASRNLTLDAR